MLVKLVSMDMRGLQCIGIIQTVGYYGATNTRVVKP